MGLAYGKSIKNSVYHIKVYGPRILHKKELSSSTSVFRISLYIEVASAVTSCLKKSKKAVDLFGKKPLSDIKVNNKNKLILTEIKSFLKKLHPFN